MCPLGTQSLGMLGIWWAWEARAAVLAKWAHFSGVARTCGWGLGMCENITERYRQQMELGVPLGAGRTGDCVDCLVC